MNSRKFHKDNIDYYFQFMSEQRIRKFIVRSNTYLTVASSEIAANVISGGKTAHSMSNISIEVDPMANQ